MLQKVKKVGLPCWKHIFEPKFIVSIEMKLTGDPDTKKRWAIRTQKDMQEVPENTRSLMFLSGVNANVQLPHNLHDNKWQETSG